MSRKYKEKNEGVSDFGIDIIKILSEFQEVELENVEIKVKELEFLLQPFITRIPLPKVEAPLKVKPKEILMEEFHPPIMKYPGEIVEVKIGATKSEGGTRGRTVTIGGEKAPAFYLFEYPPPNPPVISIDVFDMKIPLAKAVKMHVEDVLEDPAAWAKKAVDKWGAEVINLHLVSIDPLLKDTKPSEAAKTVEEVLQAVDVPLAVGGCGDPEKDLKVFEKVAEVAEGENILFNSVTLNMDIKRTAEAIKKHNHCVIAFTAMNMDDARELNRKLYEFLPKNKIVIDTTTAALGYGLEYAFTVMERTRLAALMGDTELQHPISSGTTNAWAAREAWISMDPKWGPKELRGPIWETVSALTLLLAGVDYFMMMHPAAVKTVKEVIKKLTVKEEAEKIYNWIVNLKR
ncbi:MAG: CO dehydrogenase/acetyl-CoA synthase subunit delta [Candidatus Bathyarchaeia archaeon]|nr:CO dehydrogenase/acetyl-CoA synthase subunit delta [Candidatus Bathyarchaeota archaeon]